MAPRNRASFDRSLSSDATYTRAAFRRDFPDDAACLEWLKDYRWPDGIVCPKCQRVTGHSRGTAGPYFACNMCGHHVHPTAGTIFHRSSTNLVLWFEAIFLVASTRCGISAKQLEREIGVTYKTAWRMMRLIRTLMAEDGEFRLSGDVESDETYFTTSKRSGKSGWSPGERVVWGAVERGGRVVAKHVPDATMPVLGGNVLKYVLPDSTVFTDESRSYQSLGRAGYFHRRIKHSAHVYVDGDVHTNTIEGFWSLLKRGISGVYHSVSAKHLQHYLDEYTFRYNHRTQEKGPMFSAILERVAPPVRPAPADPGSPPVPGAIPA
jgi:transposase-like protein